MDVDPAVAEAIIEAVKAGVFWNAARLNPKTRATWEQFAAVHHDRAGTLLAEAVDRLGADGSRPERRSGGGDGHG